ncbi:signal transduction histidine kinase/ligand-binding sensor domain-containing protein/DNA-binding response OmpR family regulator [Parabacteroides sp. PFB2-12]|uniref:hybrid sensor histidine kinase/response regulator transcription factor n=1 Tax=unclassified Parabacteroides TaxID=2649774 RepID=UPI0024768298|nr:two-component regulator propeller domain-containing protein [Parabacteroides sp. PFB2-12]MDH6343516.1 signal transduction histidine kinase/ligand-binding sensor domain-containing protein/DNA-binding response OmpR family regulator [Parabacteroides sp. PM6-13]MDH6390884.1 signal transduction histidine kinase/ligand-binding sensor domain-containing protein/DNA-binding response OmpR family regulator [Parabacteroides sp. PFB2-12]
MKNRLIFCALLLSVLLYPLAPSDIQASVDVRSTFITSNDGLGNNFVRHVFQDSKGFLWMSTLNGLTRYDGHSFVTFVPEKGDKPSLTDRHIREVTEDKNHFLWIRLSPEYFNCYDLENECFVEFTQPGEPRKSYSTRMEASNGDSWLWHSRQGCRRVFYKEGKLESTEYNVENGKLLSNHVRQVKEDLQGNIWICTDSGLVKVMDDVNLFIDRHIAFYDMIPYGDEVFLLSVDGAIYKVSEGDRVEFVEQLTSKEVQEDITDSFPYHDSWVILTSLQGHVFHLSEEKTVPNDLFQIAQGRKTSDKQGNICVYDTQGLVRYINIETGQKKDFHIPIGDRVTDQWCKIMLDSRGWLWIATFGCGLYVYNPEADEIRHFTYQIDGLNHICSNSLAFIMEDRSGGIWVTSESAGVSRLTVLNDRATYFYPEDKSVMDNNNAIRLIEQKRNGEIWIGNRDCNLYRYDSGLTNILETKRFPSSVYALMEEPDGQEWYGTRGHGALIHGKWYAKGKAPYKLPAAKVFQFFRDYKERIWMGVLNGGLVWLKSEEERYSFQRFMTKSIKQSNIRHIVSDKNNWMWVGTDDGLYVFHPDSLIASPEKYHHYDFNKGDLPANAIRYMLYDSRERMWIGTIGGGLALCDADKGYDQLTFSHYTTSDGLVNNVVQSIAEDQEGELWIATEYGMSRFSPDSRTFENFFFSNIVQENVFTESSVLRLPDGRLLFGTSHGVLMIDPGKIKSPDAFMDIKLTDLKINGISMRPNEKGSPLTRSIAYTDKIQMKYDQNSFVVDFSSFDYSMINSAKYTYKLEPFDSDWSTPSTLNFAAYKMLNPGTYHLRVRACNSAGIWSEEEARLEIVIKPPYWKSPLAYTLYVILLMILLYVAFRLARHYQRLQNRVQVEKQLTEYKLMFFTNISHEFRTPLSLIKGALEKIEEMGVASKEMDYPIRLMSKSTDRLLRLINQLLEFRKMQNNKLKLQLEQKDIIPFIREIFLHFEEAAHNKNLDYRFESSVPHYMMYFDGEKLDKIIYNLLSNACKYTPNEGSVVFSLHIEEENNQLVMAVRDTGIGIPKEKQSELFSRFMQSSFAQDSVGVGLHLTQELVYVHKGNIMYQENEGGGSVFTVFLPLDNSLYEESDFVTAYPQGRIGEVLLEDEAIEDKIERDIASDPDFSAFDGANKKKILLIEDDPDVNKYLETELSHYFEVITATDGTSGLACAKHFDGDLILCDVLMPGMNGFEVTRQLKGDFATSHIPIILLTAMNTPENQLEGTKSGADAYVTKPFSLKLLLARIYQLIEQRELLREKFLKDPVVMNPALSSTQLDQKFAGKLNQIMEEELSNPDFTIDDFAARLHLGRSAFFRKVKGVTGYTPNRYMQIFRMKRAMEFLVDGEYNISEITYKVGMKDPHYFSRCFKEQFGMAPSMYLRGSKEKGANESQT